MKARLRRRLRRIRRALSLRPPHARREGERAAYYFDAAEIGVTTTTATDETW